jgi:hypothetical protein
MNLIKLHVLLLSVAATLSTACDRNLGQEAPRQFLQDLNNEIANDIRKSFPLPEPIVINNANGDVVNYTTTLTVAMVVDFYRQAYRQQSGTEMPEEASVSSDSAKLAFHTSTGNSVYIRVEKDDAETKVRLQKK